MRLRQAKTTAKLLRDRMKTGRAVVYEFGEYYVATDEDLSGYFRDARVVQYYEPNEEKS